MSRRLGECDYIMMGGTPDMLEHNVAKDSFSGVRASVVDEQVKVESR